MTNVLTQSESLTEFRARRRREAVGKRGPAAFVWGDFVTRPDQRVEGAPGLWAPLPDARAGLRVRAVADEGIRIGGELVNGEAVLHHASLDGPAVAEFPDGAEGVIFTYDGSKYALQVWNQQSAWARRFDDISTFAEDTEWIVDATVRPAAAGETVTITHHRDPVPVEVLVAADVEFEHDGQTHRVVATTAFADRLLIHFRDATSGAESYGAGRSVLLPEAALATGRAVIDFNRATLLPCSFSLAWNCPLPPAANTLPIAVRAGERHAVDADGEPLL